MRQGNRRNVAVLRMLLSNGGRNILIFGFCGGVVGENLEVP
jgi:hypothetical protein